jgi:hypothetical protein
MNQPGTKPMPMLKAAESLAKEISEVIELSKIQMMSGISKKHQETADSVKNRYDACRWKTVTGQIFQGVDVAEFRPLAGEFGHVGTFWV